MRTRCAQEHWDPGSPTLRCLQGAPSLALRVLAFQQAFWKFLRPHTIRGTILGSCAVTAKAVLENTHLIDYGLLPRAALGVLALICGNGYIVGINQIIDEDIDKVNKPFLPIAAGEIACQSYYGCPEGTAD